MVLCWIMPANGKWNVFVCVRLSKWERYVCDMYSISSLQIAKLFTIYTKWLCSRRHRISNESNVKWLLATDVTAISSECEIECVIVLVVCRSDGCSRGEGIDGSKNEGPDEGRGLESCKLRRSEQEGRSELPNLCAIWSFPIYTHTNAIK